MSSNEKLIVLDDVCKHFKVSGGMLKAVDHISLDIYKGETLGLVGDISEEGIYRGLKKLLDDGALREILTERLAFVTKNEKNFSQIMALLE